MIARNCRYVLNIIRMPLSLFIVIAKYFISLLIIEIGHLNFILSTLFYMPKFMFWQILAFKTNRYDGQSHINVAPLYIVIVMKPLKYIITIIFILLFIFFHFFFFLMYISLFQILKLTLFVCDEWRANALFIREKVSD